MRKAHSLLVFCDDPRLMPEKAHACDAGYDLRAACSGQISPGMSSSISCGISIALPAGCEGQVRGRSGLAFKDRVLCHVGTLDAGYRGEIAVMLFNLHHHRTFVYNKYDRIAQLVVARLWTGKIEIAAALPPSERGAAGFGSTGTGALAPKGL